MGESHPGISGAHVLGGVLGDEASIALVKAFGGRSVRIPRTNQSLTYTELHNAIGEDGARTLMREFAGESVYIPKLSEIKRQARNNAIRHRFDELTQISNGNAGISSRKAVDFLTREFDLCGKQIERIVNS